MLSADDKSSIRVLVVDDVPGVVDTVVGYLSQNANVECIGFSNASVALEHFTPGQFDCVISDLKMPGMTGDELWCEMVGTDPDISLVFISGAIDLRTAVKIMANGAVSVLEKPLDAQDLVGAVYKAAARTERLRSERAAFESVAKRYQELTDEEIAVLDCMLTGLSNKATAIKLTISERTVDRRRHSIFQKLEADSIIQLATVVSQIRQLRDRKSKQSG